MYQTTVTLAFCGPPSVRMLTESKSCRFQIVAITTAKKKVGRISGRVMWMSCCQPFAPSIVAAW